MMSKNFTFVGGRHCIKSEFNVSRHSSNFIFIKFKITYNLWAINNIPNERDITKLSCVGYISV